MSLISDNSLPSPPRVIVWPAVDLGQRRGHGGPATCESNRAMQVLKRSATFLLAAVLLIQGAAAQAINDHVTFDAAPYVLGRLQQRQALERGEMVVASSQAIDGYLSKPEGEGPFAALVYLHGCAGLSERTREHFARLLTGWGYVVLAVDSF